MKNDTLGLAFELQVGSYYKLIGVLESDAFSMKIPEQRNALPLAYINSAYCKHIRTLNNNLIKQCRKNTCFIFCTYEKRCTKIQISLVTKTDTFICR